MKIHNPFFWECVLNEKQRLKSVIILFIVTQEIAIE